MDDLSEKEKRNLENSKRFLSEIEIARSKFEIRMLEEQIKVNKVIGVIVAVLSSIIIVLLAFLFLYPVQGA